MAALIAPYAYVDFSSERSLEDIACELSSRVFGGIPFVGSSTGIWDEVPAMRLATRFIGLEVEVGGAPEDGYTVQIEAPDFPWQLIESSKEREARVDLSGLLEHLLSNIPGITRTRCHSDMSSARAPAEG